MRRTVILLALLLAGVANAHAADLWIHMKIVKSGFRPSVVRMNLPLASIEKAMPLIPDERDLTDMRIEIDGNALTAEALSLALEALHNAPAGQHARIATFDATFDVTRDSADLVFVSMRDHSIVRLPEAFAQAAADDGELDLRATVRAIVGRGAGNVVTVTSDDARIDIWVDGNAGMR